MRVWCYIDGFNLYNGIVRKYGLKWVNLKALCEAMVPPGDSVERVNYFTALVNPRATNPDTRTRQEAYWQALRTVPEIRVIPGFFPPAKPRWKPIASSVDLLELNAKTGTRVVVGEKPDMIRVMESTEKGTDVYLAIHLLNDAHHGRFEKAVVVSADSDLVGAISMAQSESGLPIGVFNPHAENHCNKLRGVATFFCEIRKIHLSQSLFPDTMPGKAGHTITKPTGW